MIKKVTVLCLMVVYITACKPGSQKEVAATVKDLKWLEGEWINTADSPTVTYETWRIVNDSLMVGEGYTIEAKDTVFHEMMEIKAIDNVLCYIPSVDNQNEGKPVVFQLKNADGNAFEFSNPEHDFPQIIVYQKQGNDSLLAWIAGMNNGKEKKMSFPFKRK